MVRGRGGSGLLRAKWKGNAHSDLRHPTRPQSPHIHAPTTYPDKTSLFPPPAAPPTRPPYSQSPKSPPPLSGSRAPPTPSQPSPTSPPPPRPPSPCAA